MKSLLFTIGSVFALVSVTLIAGAQTTGLSTGQAGPQILINWQAATYIPNEYIGRALPSGNSLVVATLDVVQNNRLLDLKNQTVYWYLNDELIASGANQWQVSFRTPEIPGGSSDLRAELPGLAGAVLKTITIPTVNPVVAIPTQFPSGAFRGSQIKLTSAPFFFNVGDVSQLTFNWRVNGKPPESSEDPRSLALTINPGTADGFPIDINLAVHNPITDFETASRAIHLVYRQ